MLAAEALARTGGGAHHQGHSELPATEVPHRGGLGRELVERDTDELDEHHLDHRASYPQIAAPTPAPRKAISKSACR
jgi:hypothetical protein